MFYEVENMIAEVIGYDSIRKHLAECGYHTAEIREKRKIYKAIETICGKRNCTTISCSAGEHEESEKLTKQAVYVNNAVNTENCLISEAQSMFKVTRQILLAK